MLSWDLASGRRKRKRQAGFYMPPKSRMNSHLRAPW